MDYFERRSRPFIVAVNPFEGALQFDLEEVREALDVPAHVPMVSCDARDLAAVKTALTTLMEYLVQRGAVA